MDYLDYWQLQEKPFENTGDPKFFYYSSNHKEALVRSVYVIKNKKSGVLLAGDYGTGKTTIAKELLFEIAENDVYNSVYINNPLLTEEELIQEIAYQLGFDEQDAPRLRLRHMIEQHLQDFVSDEKHTIILVDEAHLMKDKNVLEELRLLMNLQVNNKLLVTVIMMGQLELRDTINALPQFKQRFAMCYVLQHLDMDETAGYVNHRIKIAGGVKDLFSHEAQSLIFMASKGRPREVNNICDMALLVGYMRNAEQIDGDTIREVIRDSVGGF